jgi:hypothetical protein
LGRPRIYRPEPTSVQSRYSLTQTSRYILSPAYFSGLPELSLSTAEYEDIRYASRCLLEVLGVEERLDVMLSNYFEFEHEMLTTTLTNAIYPQNHLESDLLLDAMQQIGRRVSNLFTTARAYIEQFPHVMNLLYGKNSAQCEAVKSYQSAEFDAKLGYRVCEMLRNYVQHDDLGVHGIQSPMSWTRPKDGPKFLSYSIVPTVSVDKLLASAKVKRQTVKELEALGNRHDLKPLIREYVTGLGRAHLKTRTLIEADVAKRDSVIAGAIDRFRAQPGAAKLPFESLAAVQVNRQGVWTESTRVNVFRGPIQRRERFYRKNSKPIHFHEMVITSTIPTNRTEVQP